MRMAVSTWDKLHLISLNNAILTDIQRHLRRQGNPMYIVLFLRSIVIVLSYDRSVTVESGKVIGVINRVFYQDFGFDGNFDDYSLLGKAAERNKVYITTLITEHNSDAS